MAPTRRSLLRCSAISARAVLLALSLFLFSNRAFTQSAPSLVVIITVEPGAPAARRLARDLESLGLDVLVLRATPENSSGRASLEKSARGLGAIAAVRLVVSGQGTEVWVADRVTGKTLIRELVGTTDSPARAEDVALGAIELLRASLMELHAPASPRGEAELTNEVRALSFPTADLPRSREPVLPAFAMSAGPSIDFGLGAIGPSLHSYWAAWMGVGLRFGVRAFASLALLPERTTVSEGTVELTTNVLGLGVTYELLQQDGTLVPVVGIGATGARVATIGHANLPYGSTSDAGWFAGAYGQLGLAWKILPGLRTRFDAMAIVLPSRPTVEANQRSLGRWGAPAVLASIGLEVVLTK